MKSRVIFILTGFGNFLRTVYQRRFLIFQMAKRDIMTQHVDSTLGIFWTFINPIINVFILWPVFGVGFKAAPKGNVPFVVWLTAAMAIWNTFREIVNSSISVIISNSHLVNKVVFPSAARAQIGYYF